MYNIIYLKVYDCKNVKLYSLSSVVCLSQCECFSLFLPSFLPFVSQNISPIFFIKSRTTIRETIRLTKLLVAYFCVIPIPFLPRRCKHSPKRFVPKQPYNQSTYSLQSIRPRSCFTDENKKQTHVFFN